MIYIIAIIAAMLAIGFIGIAAIGCCLIDSIQEQPTSTFQYIQCKHCNQSFPLLVQRYSFISEYKTQCPHCNQKTIFLINT